MRPVRLLADAIRGALIGVVEIIPGVSGGTVALIVGVYERLLDSAAELVRGVARALVDLPRGRGLARAREHLVRVAWSTVLPLAVGMVVALLVAARLVAPLVEEHPVLSRAFFSGLVLVAIAVPARMVGGRWTAREWAFAVPCAVAGFVASGLPFASLADPSLWVVGLAAAVAVCALVLPGLSGSFLLLVLGLYEPTLRALNERDLAYVAAFGGGMVVGLGLFVQALRWLLAHRRRATLAVMTGLMAGSLRALWPWQDADRQLSAPGPDAGPAAAWFVAGMALVGVLLVVEAALVRRRLATGEDVLDPDPPGPTGAQPATSSA